MHVAITQESCAVGVSTSLRHYSMSLHVFYMTRRIDQALVSLLQVEAIGDVLMRGCYLVLAWYWYSLSFLVFHVYDHIDRRSAIALKAFSERSYGMQPNKMMS